MGCKEKMKKGRGEDMGCKEKMKKRRREAWDAQRNEEKDGEA